LSGDDESQARLCGGQLGKVTIEFMRSRGMTFTPEQISAGKLRAEEYSKTNHISPKTIVEIPGL
jgi:hypothetical protein